MKYYLSFLAFTIGLFIFGLSSFAIAQTVAPINYCDGTNDPITCVPVDTDVDIDTYLKEDWGTSEEMTPQEQVEARQKKAVELKIITGGLNPLNITDPKDIFGIAINALMAFIGSITLILYIYSGLLWMSAGGNTEKITKAKTILIWTTLGAVAMGGSYMIVKVVLEKIG